MSQKFCGYVQIAIYCQKVGHSCIMLTTSLQSRDDQHQDLIVAVILCHGK